MKILKRRNCACVSTYAFKKYKNDVQNKFPNGIKLIPKNRHRSVGYDAIAIIAPNTVVFPATNSAAVRKWCAR